MSSDERRKILKKVMKDTDYETTVQRLNQLANLTTDEPTHEKARSDMAWMKQTYRAGDDNMNMKKYRKWIPLLLVVSITIAVLYYLRQQGKQSMFGAIYEPGRPPFYYSVPRGMHRQW